MYTPIQIEAIELFGSKELSFGCKCITTDIDGWEDQCTFLDWNEWLVIHDVYKTIYKANPRKISDTSRWITILWHIPHLEDVFRVAEEKWFRVKYELWELKFFDMKDYGCGWLRLSVSFQNIPLIDQPSLPEIIKLFRND